MNKDGGRWSDWFGPLRKTLLLLCSYFFLEGDQNVGAATHVRRQQAAAAGPRSRRLGVFLLPADEGVDAVLLTCPPLQLLLPHIHDKPSFYGDLRAQIDVPQRVSPICTSVWKPN